MPCLIAVMQWLQKYRLCFHLCATSKHDQHSDICGKSDADFLPCLHRSLCGCSPCCMRLRQRLHQWALTMPQCCRWLQSYPCSMSLHVLMLLGLPSRVTGTAAACIWREQTMQHQQCPRSTLQLHALQATMQGFAVLAGEDGIVSLDTLAPAPAFSFPAAHSSALAAAAAALLPPEQQPAPHGSVSVLQLLAAAAAVGLVPRPGTGAVFSRWPTPSISQSVCIIKRVSPCKLRWGVCNCLALWAVKFALGETLLTSPPHADSHDNALPAASMHRQCIDLLDVTPLCGACSRLATDIGHMSCTQGLMIHTSVAWLL